MISASQVESHLSDKQWRLLDCRFDLANPAAGRLAWQAGHIPGAVYADLDHDLAAPVTAVSGRHPLPDADTLCSTFSSMGIDAGKTVVVYDDGNGAIAARAWWLLRWLGHARVALLDKGFAGWQQTHREIEKGDVTVEPRPFRGLPQWGRVITTDELVKASDAQTDIKLVDARDAARFRGEQEPIDTIAGHIPGALNVPFTRNLKTDGSWKSPEVLRTVWAPVLGSSADTDWSVMCGSGVTACHLALSGLLAGYREPRLYVGSWSEWIRDPRRPVRRGA